MMDFQEKKTGNIGYSGSVTLSKNGKGCITIGMLHRLIEVLEESARIDEIHMDNDEITLEYTVFDEEFLNENEDTTPKIRHMVEETWRNVQSGQTTAGVYGDLETQSVMDTIHNIAAEASESM